MGDVHARSPDLTPSLTNPPTQDDLRARPRLPLRCPQRPPRLAVTRSRSSSDRVVLAPSIAHGMRNWSRRVAIKIPNRERLRRPEDADEYVREARILASLEHPNIVPVYDIGRTADGLPYVVSKFVKGSWDLAARMRSGALPVLGSGRFDGKGRPGFTSRSPQRVGSPRRQTRQYPFGNTRPGPKWTHSVRGRLRPGPARARLRQGREGSRARPPT